VLGFIGANTKIFPDKEKEYLPFSMEQRLIQNEKITSPLMENLHFQTAIFITGNLKTGKW